MLIDASDSTIDSNNNTIIRDYSYYPIGSSNPLAETQKRSMYWRDSYDVLNDLHLFQSLAVRFHSCV
jgi:hypothetical protein